VTRTAAHNKSGISSVLRWRVPRGAHGARAPRICQASRAVSGFADVPWCAAPVRLPRRPHDCAHRCSRYRSSAGNNLELDGVSRSRGNIVGKTSWRRVGAIVINIGIFSSSPAMRADRTDKTLRGLGSCLGGGYQQL